MLGFKKKKKKMEKRFWIITYANILFKNHVAHSEDLFIYEKRHSIDKKLFCEVSFSNSRRSPIDRIFRKANAFSGLGFEDK